MSEEIAKRMKEFYEEIPQTKLVRRTPVVIRVDGVAFHTFAKKFQKPFDKVLMKAMQDTMKYLCEHIQGCVIGYTQSDEITLILQDYKSNDTDAWFGYRTQKLCSVSASMATMAFNKFFREEVEKLMSDIAQEYEINGQTEWVNYMEPYCKVYREAIDKGAMFDARCFNIPKEEVTNLLYWRQLDARRNSIQMLGQAYFSHKDLHGTSCNKIQDMLMAEKGIDWNDCSIPEKRGSCCIRITYHHEDGTLRNKWEIDKRIPIFRDDGRTYIESKICFDFE